MNYFDCNNYYFKTNANLMEILHYNCISIDFSYFAFSHILCEILEELSPFSPLFLSFKLLTLHETPTIKMALHRIFQYTFHLFLWFKDSFSLNQTHLMKYHSTHPHYLGKLTAINYLIVLFLFEFSLFSFLSSLFFDLCIINFLLTHLIILECFY